MPIVVESVSGATVPRELALRLALGRAVEVLALVEATSRLPAGGEDVLRRVATELRLPAAVWRHERQSLAETASQLEVLIVAVDALGSIAPDELLGRLESLADDLDDVASGKVLADNELEQLIEALGDLRRAVASMRATLPDEVSRALR